MTKSLGYVSYDCPGCGVMVVARQARVNASARIGGKPPYCSTECSALHRSEALRRPLRVKFEEKVAAFPSDDCWLWTGSSDRRGYGQMRHDGRLRIATHLSLLIYRNVEVPLGMMACHRCDTPACVNPEHLFIGTASDNMRDCARKGRLSPPPRAKRHDRCSAGHDLTQPGGRYESRHGGCVLCARRNAKAQKARRRAAAHVGA